MNHQEIPWIEARGDLNDSEICDEVIDTDLMKRYYKSKALERGMKEVKNNIFKFSPARLKKAQDNLRKKEVFKVNEENYEEYEKFILDSYEATLDFNVINLKIVKNAKENDVSKIYLIEISYGLFDSYYTNIIKAFYTKEKANQFKNEYNENQIGRASCRERV